MKDKTSDPLTKRKVQIYNGAVKKKGKPLTIVGAEVTLADVISRVRSGDRNLAEKTQECRRLYQALQVVVGKYPEDTDEHKAKRKAAKDAYDAVKITLPAVTFAGTFSERGSEYLLNHSGLIVLDIDGVPENEIGDLLSETEQLPFVVFAYVSPSGAGVKPVVSVTPVPRNPLEHKAAWAACKDAFSPLGYEVDSTGSDVSRLSFFSHTPNPVIRLNAGNLELESNEAYLSELKAQKQQRSDARVTYDGEVDITALDFIDPDYSYEQWVNVGMGCHDAGLPCDVWDRWSAKGAKYEAGLCQKKWDSFGADRGTTWGTVIHLARQGGYTPRRSYRRLNIDGDAQQKYKQSLRTQEQTDKALAADTQAFVENPTRDGVPRYTVMKYETGAGKSTTLLTHAREGDKKVLSLLHNHTIATEQTAAAESLGYDAFRYRGRGHGFHGTPLANLPVKMRNRDESLFRKYNVLCPVYDDLERYQQRRLAPFPYCLRCPLLETCKQEGYWSQFSVLRDADYISACIQTLLFNPDYASLLNVFLTGGSAFESEPTETDSLVEDVIGAMLGIENANEKKEHKPFDFAIIDDYTVAGLWTDVTYPFYEYSQLNVAWQGTETGEVIDRLCNAIVKLGGKEKDTSAAVSDLRTLFESLDANTRAQVDKDLTQHVMTVNGQRETMPPWDAINNYHISVESLTPTWHNPDWTILNQIEAVLKHTQNDSQAPFFMDKHGTLTLSIPPQVNPKLKDVLFTSATADIEMTRNSFIGQQVTIQSREGKPTQLADGVQLYQYVTARLTTQSVFEYERDVNDEIVRGEDGKPVIAGLKEKAIALLEKLCEFAENTDKKSVFTSWKEFTDPDSPIAEHNIVKRLQAAFDSVSHYDIVAGQNFDGYRVFVNLGYPKVDPYVVNRESRKQNAHDATPLDLETYLKTDSDGEVYTSHHAVYADRRVDKIRQQLATDKIRQAIGRGRQTRWVDTIIINLCAEPVPSFTELATPITYQDILSADTFDLGVVVNRTISEIVEQDEVSEREAYRRTQTQRKLDKSEQKRKAKELDKQEAPVSEIVDILGISQRTFYDWKAKDFK